MKPHPFLHQTLSRLRDWEDLVAQIADPNVSERNLHELRVKFEDVQKLKSVKGDATEVLVICVLKQLVELVWSQFLWLSSGKKVIELLADFCQALKPDKRGETWISFNLYLTVVAAAQGNNDLVRKLRRINSNMTLQDLVECDPTALHDTALPPILRCGLALQVYVDVIESAVNPSTHATGVLDLSWALLEKDPYAAVNRPLFPDRWIHLVRASFPSGADHVGADTALKLVKTAIEVLERMDNHGERKTTLYASGKELWGNVLKSLSLEGLVTVLTGLFSQEVATLSLVCCGSVILDKRLMGADDDADEEGFYKLTALLQSLHNCKTFYVDEEEREGSRQRLHMVVYAVKLYMTVILDVARGSTRHREVLDAKELRQARSWLLRLREEVKTAKVEGWLRHEYEATGLDALDLALMMTRDPINYKYGLPLGI